MNALPFLIDALRGAVRVGTAGPCLLDAGSRVVLVGNGPGVLRAELGEVIDGFDEVIRFNAYRLQGFERHTGRRTTIWSTFGRGVLPGDEGGPVPEKVLFVHGSRGKPAIDGLPTWRVPLSFYQALREAVQAVTLRTGKDMERLIPSSGLVVALWCLTVLELEVLHFVGLDHFRKECSKLHHYWVPKGFGKPAEHDGEAEAVLLAPYAQAGRFVAL
jgi:hypothetical protein